ncbi:MAG: hypothetical protein JWO19_2254 [Bryobacterales bacterium]|nr:hypothetical protein [Bryobacterales bacterium]
MSVLEWIPCEESFVPVTSDVVSWTEPYWPPTRRRRKKVKPWGEHRVTAEVLEVDSRDFVRLSVLKDEITKNPHGMPLKLLKKGEVIVKKRATIGRGKPERLEWTDETVRAIEVSRFLH